MTAKQITKRLKNPLRRGCGCLLIVVLGVMVYYGAYLLTAGPRPANPQLIAHRGGPVYAPENTGAAFTNAVAAHSNWLEMDVQRTQDGDLVVIHDETVDRTTNSSGMVKDFQTNQIRALNAGDGEKVPFFSEVIRFAKEAEVGILPEAKSPSLYPGIAADMVQAIVDAGYEEHTIVQSFDPETLEEIRSINPEIQICPLYGLWKLNLRPPYPGNANVLCPMAEMVILNPWMIRQAQTEGRKVFVWFGVIENPTTMRLILTLGVDGVMVDDPVALAKVLGR